MNCAANNNNTVVGRTYCNIKCDGLLVSDVQKSQPKCFHTNKSENETKDYSRDKLLELFAQ